MTDLGIILAVIIISAIISKIRILEIKAQFSEVEQRARQLSEEVRNNHQKIAYLKNLLELTEKENKRLREK